MTELPSIFRTTARSNTYQRQSPLFRFQFDPLSYKKERLSLQNTKRHSLNQSRMLIYRYSNNQSAIIEKDDNDKSYLYQNSTISYCQKNDPQNTSQKYKKDNSESYESHLREIQKFTIYIEMSMKKIEGFGDKFKKQLKFLQIDQLNKLTQLKNHTYQKIQILKNAVSFLRRQTSDQIKFQKNELIELNDDLRLCGEELKKGQNRYQKIQQFLQKLGNQ